MRPVLKALGLFAILAPLFSQAPALAQQTVILKQKQTTSGIPGQDGGETTITVYYGSGAMKHADSEGSEVVIDFQNQKTVVIDHGRKTYAETSFEEMRRMVEQVNAEMERQREELEAQLQGNPQAAQLLGQMAPGEVTMTALGEAEPVAGYTTRKYQISVPPMMEIEMWSAPDLQVPDAYYDAMKLQSAGANPFIDMAQLFEAMKQVEGLSVKTVVTISMMGMTMTSTTETTEVQRGEIPDSVFAIPDGYQKTAVQTP